MKHGFLIMVMGGKRVEIKTSLGIGWSGPLQKLVGSWASLAQTSMAQNWTTEPIVWRIVLKLIDWSYRQPHTLLEKEKYIVWINNETILLANIIPISLSKKEKKNWELQRICIYLYRIEFKVLPFLWHLLKKKKK